MNLICVLHNVLFQNERCVNGRAEWKKGLRVQSLAFENKIGLFVGSFVRSIDRSFSHANISHEITTSVWEPRLRGCFWPFAYQTNNVFKSGQMTRHTRAASENSIGGELLVSKLYLQLACLYIVLSLSLWRWHLIGSLLVL